MRLLMITALTALVAACAAPMEEPKAEFLWTDPIPTHPNW